VYNVLRAQRPSPRTESLRAALRGDAPLVATFLMVPRVEMIEMLSLAGFDAVIIDLEHGPMTVEDLPSLAAAAQGSGLYAVARLAMGGAAEVGAALDAGLDGVLAPHVSSPEAARALVEAGRFPPLGSRSLNPYVRGTAYGVSDGAGPEAANERVALVAMVEGDNALGSLDAIVDVDGLDAVFVGPVDLSGSLGFPGQPEHPTVVAAVRDIFDRLGDRGTSVGIFAPTPEAANRWIGAGAALVALSADAAMAMDGFARFRAAVAARDAVLPDRS
jgi:2-keto-3-deoxy-L-rhamnonate aldolase RhmA